MVQILQHNLILLTFSDLEAGMDLIKLFFQYFTENFKKEKETITNRTWLWLSNAGTPSIREGWAFREVRPNDRGHYPTCIAHIALMSFYFSFAMIISLQ